MLRLRELAASPKDLALLRRFYAELYLPEFPDPNERESLDNMVRYLELKAEGWYGDNNYHILVMEDDESVVAGSISDYLAEPNAGFIEFLVVSRTQRGRKTGKQLLDWTESVLDQDAQQIHARGPACIAAEMNDPFKPTGIQDSLSPFLRAEIWGRWGYHKVDFPYVQPPLSDDKESVHYLLLMAKPLDPAFKLSLPADLIASILRDFMRWAIRIDDPTSHAAYRAMTAYLDRVDPVPLIPLLRYIGNDDQAPFVIREIRSVDDPEFGPALSIYGGAFRNAATAVRTSDFETHFRGGGAYVYHLWSVGTNTSEGGVTGMASFFTLQEAGFGGYVAFDGASRRQGRLRPLLALIERRMIEDGTDARGWYIECESEVNSQIFRRVGFVEVDVDYRQPPLHGDVPASLEEGHPLRLLYKDFGSTYGKPHVTCASFKSAVSSIFSVVYRIDSPQQTAHFRHLISQLPDREDAPLPLR